MTNIKCPKCGNGEWMAIESFTSQTPCSLVREKTGEIEIQFDMRAELAREAATSVILAYACATPDCGYTINAMDLK